MGIELVRLQSIDDFREVENPQLESKYISFDNKGRKNRMYWTIDQPLLLEQADGAVTASEKWFINEKDELIYNDCNDYFNLSMYEHGESIIVNVYKLVKG